MFFSNLTFDHVIICNFETMTQQKQSNVIVDWTWMWAGLRANIARACFSARTVPVKAIFIISIINNTHNRSCDP